MLISAFKNHYSKLSKFHKASYLFYGAFYFLIITNFVIFYEIFTPKEHHNYDLFQFKMLSACLFGMAGIVSFFKGEVKNANLGLKFLTLLTLITVGLILWFFLGPSWKNYLQGSL